MKKLVSIIIIVFSLFAYSEIFADEVPMRTCSMDCPGGNYRLVVNNCYSCIFNEPEGYLYCWTPQDDWVKYYCECP